MCDPSNPEPPVPAGFALNIGPEAIMFIVPLASIDIQRPFQLVAADEPIKNFCVPLGRYPDGMVPMLGWPVSSGVPPPPVKAMVASPVRKSRVTVQVLFVNGAAKGTVTVLTSGSKGTQLLDDVFCTYSPPLSLLCAYSGSVVG